MEEESKILEGILDKADNLFIDSIRSFQSSLFTSVSKLIKKFSKGGKLESDDTKRQLLLSLRKDIKEIFKKSTFENKVKRFLLNFSEVDRLKKEITEGLKGSKLNRQLSSLLTEEKKRAIQAVQFSLLSDDIIDAQFVKPIREILTRQITVGISEKEAISELRNFIKGNKRAGYYERYVRTIARESISRYEGGVTQLIIADTGAKYFRISGTLINNSHINCVEMINATGKLGKYHIGRGIYPICVLDQMLEIMRKRSGFVDGTNASNYFVNRNHYGCRHLFSPVFVVPQSLINKAKEIEDKYC